MKLRNSAIWLRRIIFLQGIYYFLTAVWPLVNLDSFIAVTGAKTDIWLVKTVAALIVAISVTLLASTCTPRVSKEICILAILTSLSLIIIDAYYSLNGTISAIYLMDAAPEIAFAIGAFLWFPET